MKVIDFSKAGRVSIRKKECKDCPPGTLECQKEEKVMDESHPVSTSSSNDTRSENNDIKASMLLRTRYAGLCSYFFMLLICFDFFSIVTFPLVLKIVSTFGFLVSYFYHFISRFRASVNFEDEKSFKSRWSNLLVELKKFKFSVKGIYDCVREIFFFIAVCFDKLLLLAFLDVHAAFEAVIPAKGAFSGGIGVGFAIFSILVAGSCEFWGEHDSLFKSLDCNHDYEKVGAEKRGGLLVIIIKNILSVLNFIAAFSFSFVVLSELKPYLTVRLTNLVFRKVNGVYLINTVFSCLSAAYAIVMADIFKGLYERFFESKGSIANKFFNNKFALFVSFSSGYVFFSEYFEHMLQMYILSRSTFFAFTLSLIFSFTRCLLFFSMTQGGSCCGDSDNLPEFVKTISLLTIGLLSGLEFLEFISINSSFSFVTSCVLVCLAVLSGIIVEGCFFGLLSDNAESAEEKLFTPLVNYLFPKNEFPMVIFISAFSIALTNTLAIVVNPFLLISTILLFDMIINKVKGFSIFKDTNFKVNSLSFNRSVLSGVFSPLSMFKALEVDLSLEVINKGQEETNNLVVNK